MRDDDGPAGCPVTAPTPAGQAARLARLAREARLLEFALEGDRDDARELAVRLESALEAAMDAEGNDELATASEQLEVVLHAVAERGLRLSAQMTDMDVDGVLGRARMPVLTAVLSVPDRERC